MAHSENDVDLLSFTSGTESILKDDITSTSKCTTTWHHLASTYRDDQALTSVTSSPSSYYKKLPDPPSITMMQLLSANNFNAPWLFTSIRNKLSRKHKNRKHHKKSKVDKSLSQQTLSILLDNNRRTVIERISSGSEEHLLRPISRDGTTGKWVVNEKQIAHTDDSSLIEPMNPIAYGQFNISRALSTSTINPLPYSTDDSLHLRYYHYDFPQMAAPITNTASSSIYVPKQQSIKEQGQEAVIDFTSVASMIKSYYATNRQKLGE
ncbi:unnamed protein product [Didymodactylos carnosus]|uniref:Uncharacterized protein n=1 Tax=Didymodactylos carnosus TaxID=1234261 RepID=A0A8S2U6N0_9BILA|nr:unnamed protein product [Didymodactylos carnosus]CAF4318069.1 unnamed protein product [Didymodactylos carnosus]